VYIETTIVSYLTARPSRDLVRTAHQRITRTWWEEHRRGHDLFVSQFVLDEAGEGDPDAAAKRVLALRGLPVLADSREGRALARALVEHGLLPKAAGIDALHLAMAAVHDMDVVLTWNCRHLANAAILGDIGRLVRMNEYEMPIVCTPEELMHDEGREHD
jgi:hypothetical protein